MKIWKYVLGFLGGIIVAFAIMYILGETKEKTSSNVDVMKSEENLESQENIAKLNPGNSVWIDGVEFKILERINDSIVVKFSAEEYLFEMTLPDCLELDELVLADAYSALDSGTAEVCQKYVHKQNETAFEVAVYAGASVENLCKEHIASLIQDNIMEFESTQNGKGIIGQIESDTLSGYKVLLMDKECELLVTAVMLSEDERAKEHILQCLPKMLVDDSPAHYISDTEVETENYGDRIEKMYQKYIYISMEPTKYLKENYDAPGEIYNSHYLYDFTGDSIPELVYMGDPNWICVVGEKNAVHINGDSIHWCKEQDKAYITLFRQQDGEWVKYWFTSSETGHLSVTPYEEYLTVEGEKYYCNGKKISEKEYNRLTDEIDSVYIRDAKRYEEHRTSLLEFIKSGKVLSDDYLPIIDTELKKYSVLQGVEKPVNVEKYVEALYPDIKWRTEAYLFNDGKYLVNVKELKHELDLDNEVDVYSYHYQFETDVARVSGRMDLVYNYEHGEWKLENIVKNTEHITWTLTGEWTLHTEEFGGLWISTGNVDMDAGTIHIMYKTGNTDYEFTKVNFEINENKVIFDVFVLETEYFVYEICLTANLNGIEVNAKDITTIYVEESIDMADKKNVVLYLCKNTSDYPDMMNNKAESIFILSRNVNTGYLKAVHLYGDAIFFNGKKEDGQYRYGKISNSLYDGPANSIACMNQTLDMNITDFITIGRVQLAEIVDYLGSIVYEVDDSELTLINRNSETMLENTGLVELNGEQVVALAMPFVRAIEGDNSTVDDYEMRKWEVLKIISEKLNMLDASAYTEAASYIYERMYTSLEKEDALEYLKKFCVVQESITFPNTETSQRGHLGPNGSCVWSDNYQADIAQIHLFLFGVKNYTVSQDSAEVLNGIQEVVDEYSH